MAARRQHAGPDHLGHPHARNARRRISGIPEAQRIVQADSGRDAFERGQHLGTHPPLEEGAEDYIVKPFNPQELKIRIKKILD